MKAALALLLLATVAAAQAGCGPGWGPSGEFAMGGVNGQVRAMATYDDGTGPALYVAGSFTVAGGVFASNIAKWNGSTWSPLGTGIYGGIYALAVHDDGSGMALYAAGLFTMAGSVNAFNVARWNGTSWSAVGNGSAVTSGIVFALAVHDAGSGAKLYAASASTIGYWTGSTWIPIVGGFTGTVWALASCDTGTGALLYAAGSFSFMGNVAASKIASWNGTTWSNLGAGLTTPSAGAVLTLASWNDGSGTSLYAGGVFNTISGFPASYLARWNGAAWSAPPSPLPSFGSISVLSTISYASGTALYAAMGCQVAALTPAGWTTLGCWNGIGVLALGGLATPSGTIFYAGGTGPGGVSQWTGSSWAPLGVGLSGGVDVLAALDDGTGPALYAGGAPLFPAGTTIHCVARRVGSSWSPVGGAFSGGYVRVKALTTFDSGGGPNIHAGGSFLLAGGVPAANIARWNGSGWSALGPGLNGEVRALAVGDLGQGSRLFAGGSFTSAGSLVVNRIAQWDGTSWSPLGTGIQALGNVGPPSVDALIVHDDGFGPELYAGGNFALAGGIAAAGIARWNGTSWSAVGGNQLPASAFAVFDDGAGPALHATSRNGPSPAVIKWNGTSWSFVGVSLPSGIAAAAYALAAFDDGAGSALFAAGTNGSAFSGGPLSPAVWRWDGVAWSTIISGPWAPMSGYGAPVVRTLATFDDGGGLALFGGGDFATANGIISAGVAKWTAGGPPVVLTQPATQFADPGDSLTLSVSASGAAPLGYQWRKDGVSIGAGSAPTLSVSASPPGSAATYDVLITNNCGTTTSQPATIFVRPVVLAMGQPAGAGSLKVVNARGKPGANYFTAFTFNPANATNPGSGFWLGLHIPYPELLGEFATQGPPFVGVLDAVGTSAFELPAGMLPASLSGAHVFGVTAIYDAVTLGVLSGSTIASLVLL